MIEDRAVPGTTPEALRQRIAAFPDGPPSASALASALGSEARSLSGLEPAWFGARACGPAYTVRGASGDNLGLLLAVDDADAGDVIVFATPGDRLVAYFGDILALAAQQRGLAGLVIDAPIRDRREVAELGFPTFHRGCSPLSPGKSSPGSAGVEVALDGVVIRPGDLVAADDDGVVVVAREDALAALDGAEAVLASERELCARIREGVSTRDLLAGGSE